MQQHVRSAVTLLAIVSTPLLGQAKPTVTAHADLAKWETLGAGALSPDGKFVAYDFRRADGTTELRYRAVSGGDEHTVRSASGPQFSDNNHWLLFTITPDTGGGRGAGRGGRGGGGGAANGTATASRGKVGAIDLRTGMQATFDDVQSFALSSDGAHVALRRYPSPGRRSSDLIVRDLDAGTELTFGNVSEMAWNDDGALLAMTIDVDGRTGNGVQLLDARSGAIRSLDATSNQYSGLQWRPKSNDLAAMRSRVDSAFNDTSYTVIAWRGVNGNATSKLAYDFSADASFPKDMRVASYRAPQWSEDGTTMFFGIAPRDPKFESARRAPGELPPARVQIWHAKDVRQFHQQEVNAAQERQRTMLVAWHPGQTTVVRLTEDPYEQVQVAANGTVVQTSDQAPYGPEYMSGRAVEDIYFVDPATGKRTKILSKSPFGASVSPSGKTALYQEGGQWWALDVAKNARTNLTGKIGSNFMNVEDDHPTPERRAYGAAGFTSGEKSVILYDRFDLWQVNLDGSNPMRLTRGKEDSTVYRCVVEFGAGGGRGGRGGRGGGGAAGVTSPCSLDGEGRTIDTSKPLMLTATGEYNKKSGYAKLTIGQPVQRLLWADKQVAGLRKAQDADVYLMQQQSFADSPNYFVAGASLADAKPVSNTNAFQSSYAWGKQELMSYTNRRGDKLQMMLTYPANYEPGKKYPLLVTIYEKRSNLANTYVTPNETSTPNRSIYTSRGYAVLDPDIVYRVNDPGMSAVWCVIPAVKAAIATGMIDSANVGLWGHSWGGYQTAFLVTQTNIFKSAIAGAPLTDMVSMYGSIYWNTGGADQAIFESSQGRFKGNYADNYDAYIRNSPNFHAKNVKTPLIILANDKDGAVDFNQGITYFNTLRQMNKDVILLEYVGENHGLARPINMKDYAMRQKDWFDHYLKGAPAPEWMTNGIPRIKMDEYWQSLKAQQGPVVP